MAFTSDRRLYLTADDTVVEEGDVRAVSLLIGEGGTIDAATAKRYGLVKPAEDAEPEVKAKAPTDNKAVTKAPANKAKE